MTNKYYIPKIEEFHVGFRFEVREVSPTKTKHLLENPDELNPTQYIEDGMVWTKCSFAQNDAGRTAMYSSLYGQEGVTSMMDWFNRIRVKRLDREDIEELGWEYLGFHHFYRKEEGFKLSGCDDDSHIYLHLHSDGSLSILYGNERGYGLEDASYLFSGSVKNYNELRRVMEYVGLYRERSVSC